jgi:hypothetical protein
VNEGWDVRRNGKMGGISETGTTNKSCWEVKKGMLEIIEGGAERS